MLMIDDEHKNDDNNKKDNETNHENDKYFVSEEKLKTVFNEEQNLELGLESASDVAPQNKLHYEVKSQIIENSIDGLSPINISKEMRQSFLDYSMSVITARALPDARDGLKPVHRRILYSMHEQGIIASSAHKKSARIVGDVLGKYHPHGDSSVYEAMVRMAQDFSMRYLLVDGHGNYGSIDGDPAASMRYTEARMSKLSNEMVGDLRKQTVDFIDNYDGSEQEPIVLPTRIPNLLINGTTGIAVGMATNIPPHNLKETLNGIIALAKNPDLTIEELMQHIVAPDFPTGGLILFNENVKRAYETGRGSVTIRAKTHIEELKNGKKCIVVTEIPFMVNKARLVEKIAELVKDKIIDGITDLRDESSRSGLRIVIEVRRDVFPEVLRNQLFKITSLQTNFPIQLLALVDGVPRTLNLKQICEIFINHQKDIVTRRTQFDLSKNQARAHILEGLKIAINSIDDIISIIKKSSDDKKAQETIQATFNLSELQSKAIIDMRLGRLTGLATEKMNDELHKVNLLINELSEILASPQKLIDVIVDEMNVNKGMFGDERRSEIIEGEIAIDNEDLIPQKDIAITMTTKGYVKRVALENFQIQHRGGVGTKAMTTYEDDDVDTILTTTTHTDLLIFTSFGKVYRIRAHQLPELSKQAKGVPFINLINIQKDEKVVALLTTNQYLPSQYLLTVTTKGIVKRTSLQDYSRINRNGKRALSLKDGDTLVTAMIVHNNDDIIIGGSNGSAVRFDVLTIRPMGRTAAGVRGISLQKAAIVVGASPSSSGSLILSIGQDGFGKLTPIDEYRKTNRGAKGVKSINIKKAGDLKFVSVVNGNEDILITTKQGITIRTNLSQVARSSRGTKGVKIISLNANNAIKSIAVINTEAIKEQVDEAIRKTQEIELAKLNDLKLKNIN